MTEILDEDEILCYFKSYLKEIVTIHRAMFDKILFDPTNKGKNIPIELAELFEDAANTYLEFSERISEEFVRKKISDIK